MFRTSQLVRYVSKQNLNAVIMAINVKVTAGTRTELRHYFVVLVGNMFERILYTYYSRISNANICNLLNVTCVRHNK